MFRSDGFFGFALCDFVGLGGDKGDKLNAAFDEQVAGFLSECHAGTDAEYLGDDLLNGGCSEACISSDRVMVSNRAVGESVVLGLTYNIVSSRNSCQTSNNVPDGKSNASPDITFKGHFADFEIETQTLRTNM